jgi:transposase
VRDRLRQAHPEFEHAYAFAQAFGTIVRQRHADTLTSWLTEAGASGIPEFRSFARGIQRDLSAVRAALTLNVSNGATEGHITRLKYIKRAMYGRAHFDLLRARVLAAA